LAVFGDTLHKAGGTISKSTVITEGPTVSGSVLAWAFFGSQSLLVAIVVPLMTLLTCAFLIDLNGILGNYATLGLNIADFSRYADKPSAQNIQAIVIPCIFSMYTT
jgi:NCS1 family nucleobase:cation symporter-1